MHPCKNPCQVVFLMNHPILRRIKWTYILKLTGYTTLVILIALTFLLAEICRRLVVHLTIWDCPTPTSTPADAGLTFYQTALIHPQPGQTLTAWYVPSKNGAAVLLLQGHWSARDSRLAEAAMLARHGYGVMLLDPHPCVGPDVPHTVGYAEVADVAAAVEFMRQQPDITGEKIGVDGFSVGGVIAVESAARNPNIKAVIAEGSFHDLTDNITPRAVQGNPIAGLVRWLIVFFYHYYTGLDPTLVRPIDSVARISPRALFLIAGAGEAADNHTLAQFEAAGQPKELWLVPEVGHGGYFDRWPEVYEQKVISFFNRYLLGL